MSARSEKLLGAFAEDLSTRYARRSVPEYLSHARKFVGWMGGRGVELPRARPEDLLEYQSELARTVKPNGKPYSLGLQLNRLVSVRTLFRFLYRRGWILFDPSASLILPRIERRLPRVLLTPKEASRVLAAASESTPRGLRDRALLETLYATGLRVRELGMLSRDHADLEEGKLRVVRGKGSKDRVVPLTPAAVESLERYLLRGRPRLQTSLNASFLFLSDKGGFLHCAVVNRIIRRYVQRARIRKHVTCHTFRHSVATHLLKGRADIRHIQALLGHSCLSSTELYTRVEVSDLKEVMRRAHPRGR